MATNLNIESCEQYSEFWVCCYCILILMMFIPMKWWILKGGSRKLKK